ILRGVEFSYEDDRHWYFDTPNKGIGDGSGEGTGSGFGCGRSSGRGWDGFPLGEGRGERPEIFLLREFDGSTRILQKGKNFFSVDFKNCWVLTGTYTSLGCREGRCTPSK